MPNVCMDTVVFYSDAPSSEGIRKMRKAVKACYPIPRAHSKNDMCRFFEYLGIPAESLYLRGEVKGYTFKDSSIELACDSANMPMADAYDALSRHFNLEMVFMSEEPGNCLYYNTDTDGRFLKTRYRIVLSDERPEDGSLDQLFEFAGTDRDFCFSCEPEVLQWLREKGNIQAGSIQELPALMDMDYLSIYEYEALNNEKTCETCKRGTKELVLGNGVTEPPYLSLIRCPFDKRYYKARDDYCGQWSAKKYDNKSDVEEGQQPSGLLSD